MQLGDSIHLFFSFLFFCLACRPCACSGWWCRMSESFCIEGHSVRPGGAEQGCLCPVRRNRQLSRQCCMHLHQCSGCILPLKKNTTATKATGSTCLCFFFFYHSLPQGLYPHPRLNHFSPPPSHSFTPSHFLPFPLSVSAVMLQRTHPSTLCCLSRLSLLDPEKFSNALLIVLQCPPKSSPFPLRSIAVKKEEKNWRVRKWIEAYFNCSLLLKDAFKRKRALNVQGKNNGFRKACYYERKLTTCHWHHAIR